MIYIYYLPRLDSVTNLVADTIQLDPLHELGGWQNGEVKSEGRWGE